MVYRFRAEDIRGGKHTPIRTVHLFITSLAVPTGNMKRILCSDWLREPTRWAHLARFDPAQEKIIAQSGHAKFINFGQCRR